MIKTPLSSLHASDKQDSNLHHRPPRERTSPFGHYLRCTSSTVPCTPIHWTTVTTPCWLCLITPTLLTILHLPSAIYIFFHLTLPLYFYFISIFITLSLPLYYLYLYFSYFYFILIFLFSIIPITLLFLSILLSRPSLRFFYYALLEEGSV